MYQYVKRALDIIFCAIALTLLPPVMIIISILIKVDSKGAIFFKQQRIGKDGKHFDIYKFRTMVEDAEKVGTGLNSYKNDTRVTKVGEFLRTSSLDELPQLFNILKGEMSFIGPRPPVTYHPYKYSNYPLDAKIRFNVKPGVTGYAQINGRNSLSWEDKFKYDLYYVDNISFLLDLKIFILTVFKVIKMEGSYDLKHNKEQSTSLVGK
ncbi:MAG: sugar transferase [Firmicutes bacterium]|nr:sugar transferase [Bacillota bacterium]